MQGDYKRQSFFTPRHKMVNGDCSWSHLSPGKHLDYPELSSGELREVCGVGKGEFTVFGGQGETTSAEEES